MKTLSAWFHRRGWRDLLIGIPYAWLTLFFLIPFLIVVAMSLATRTPGEYLGQDESSGFGHGVNPSAGWRRQARTRARRGRPNRRGGRIPRRGAH